MGSSSNEYGDRNENSINAIGLDHKKKNNFAHASHFFVHFFAIIKRLRQQKTSNFHTPALWSGWPQQKNFLFLFLNLDVQSFWIQPQKILPTFDIKLNETE